MRRKAQMLLLLLTASNKFMFRFSLIVGRFYLIPALFIFRAVTIAIFHQIPE